MPPLALLGHFLYKRGPPHHDVTACRTVTITVQTRYWGVDEQKTGLRNAVNSKTPAARRSFQNKNAFSALQNLTFLRIRLPYRFSRVFWVAKLSRKSGFFCKAFCKLT